MLDIKLLEFNAELLVSSCVERMPAPLDHVILARYESFHTILKTLCAGLHDRLLHKDAGRGGC